MIILPIQAEEQYIILIDAGSSGSRVHVHNFTHDKKHGVPNIRPSLSKKIKPGLSAYAYDPEGGAVSLDELVEFAKRNIPQQHWKVTEIHLQATAGLRVLPEDISSAILAACRNRLILSPFKFDSDQVALISGYQEGINGWLATNYLRGIFHDPNAQPFGLIEMGGASMQVTFSPKIIPACNSPSLFIVSVGGRKFSVYSHSYLDYGLEKAQELFQRLHMDEIEKGGNPCYPLQYKHSATGSYLECSRLMDALLNKNTTCSLCKSCSFNGVFQPLITDESFYAIENFFYTTKFYGIHEEKDFCDDLRSLGHEFCGSDWNELQKKYPQENIYDLSKYCFSAAYLPKVLEHGLGLDTKQILNNVQIVKHVNGVSIDWALGAVLQAILADISTDVVVTNLPSTKELAARDSKALITRASPQTTVQTRGLDLNDSCGAVSYGQIILASCASALVMFFLVRWWIKYQGKYCAHCEGKRDALI